MIDAVNLVRNLDKLVMEGKKCCAMVTNDVQNAFNWAWCKEIFEPPERNTAVYFIRILLGFLIERRLCFDSDKGPKEY